MAALVGWSEENMKKTIEAVNNNSMSQRLAAFAFGVPKSSLRDRLHDKRGRDTLFSSTCEMILVTIMLFMADIGFAMTKLQIIDVVKKTIFNV